MSAMFVDPSGLTMPQLTFQTVVYAVVLYQASGLISGGSELLQLVPSIANIVGSVVLPILGAVPDGVMVFFSGTGPNAQETLSVGVGALAGSTVMLLTFPWFICVLYGRVPLKDGEADYSLKKSKELPDVWLSGVKYGETIGNGAKMMIGTTFLYFIIQVPASMGELGGADMAGLAAQESTWALVGLCSCIAAFVFYLYKGSCVSVEDRILTKITDEVRQGRASMENVKEIINKMMRTHEGTAASAAEMQQRLLSSEPGQRDRTASNVRAERTRKLLKQVIEPFFLKFDANGDGTLNESERGALLNDLNLQVDSGMKSLMVHDVNRDGQVNLEEFTKWVEVTDTFNETKGPVILGEDQEDIPEDLADIPENEQRCRIKGRAAWMMALGTTLVLIFSDPMVDALSEWGNRLGISPFYVSFVLAPFASNASELLSAYTFAVKRTEKTMTTSLSTLIGAACMNNTFVLAIFLALIWYKQLAWKFTAETIAMVLIQWIIGFLAIVKKTHTFTTAVLIILCYPGCLALVWFLENIAGLD